MKVAGRMLPGVVLAGILTACVATFAYLGPNEPAVRVLVRKTARISVTLFTLAFAASSLQTLFRWNWTSWLLVNRRYMGVSFAVAHGAHLAMLVTLFSAFPAARADYPAGAALAGGGLAYLFIALMTATSFDRTAALIGPKAWRVLHTVGSHYVWTLFALSYIPRALNDPWYIPLAALVIAAMTVRVAAWWVKRARTLTPQSSTN